MRYNSDAIVTSIIKNIDNLQGVSRSDFYVGITNDVERRLREHHVEAHQCLKILEATSKSEAEIAENFLIRAGLNGHPGGGGQDDTNIVYCYQITDETIQ